MTMTRRQLRRLNLAPDVIDAVLRLHEEAVAGLTHERDAYRSASEQAQTLRQERDALQNKLAALQGSREQTEAVQAAYDAYRQEVESAAKQAAVTEAAMAALRAGGANEQALPLLLKTMDLANAPVETVQDEQGVTHYQLCEPERMVAQAQADYGAFFAQPQALGVPVLSPPMGCGMLTAAEVRGMSAVQINQNWAAVKAALAQNEP